MTNHPDPEGAFRSALDVLIGLALKEGATPEGILGEMSAAVARLAPRVIQPDNAEWLDLAFPDDRQGTDLADADAAW
jgi:hypothetical protein